MNFFVKKKQVLEYAYFLSMEDLFFSSLPLLIKRVCVFLIELFVMKKQVLEYAYFFKHGRFVFLIPTIANQESLCISDWRCYGLIFGKHTYFVHDVDNDCNDSLMCFCDKFNLLLDQLSNVESRTC